MYTYSLFIILFLRDANLNILSGLDDIQTVLDDHLIKTISIRGSAFVKPIKNEVNEWFELVKRMNMTLEEWAKVQIQWLYLLPIFSSKDIIAQMPEEGSLFHVIKINNTVFHIKYFYNVLWKYILCYF